MGIPDVHASGLASRDRRQEVETPLLNANETIEANGSRLKVAGHDAHPADAPVLLTQDAERKPGGHAWEHSHAPVSGCPSLREASR